MSLPGSLRFMPRIRLVVRPSKATVLMPCLAAVSLRTCPRLGPVMPSFCASADQLMVCPAGQLFSIAIAAETSQCELSVGDEWCLTLLGCFGLSKYCSFLLLTYDATEPVLLARSCLGMIWDRTVFSLFRICLSLLRLMLRTSAVDSFRCRRSSGHSATAECVSERPYFSCMV